MADIDEQYLNNRSYDNEIPANEIENIINFNGYLYDMNDKIHTRFLDAFLIIRLCTKVSI